MTARQDTAVVLADFGARAITYNSCDGWINKSCVGMLIP